MHKKIFLPVILFLFAVAAIVPVDAFAERPEGVGRGEMMRKQNHKNQEKRVMQYRNQTTPGEGKTRACHAKEVSIKNRMSHLAQLATTMKKNFERHAQRVENYYTNTVVPSGKTVEEYDSLVANIQTQETALQTALATAQTNANSFTCASDASKEQVAQFREDMQAVKQALKEYRTAIKDLIVAVRSVTGEEDSTSPTEKP